MSERDPIRDVAWSISDEIAILVTWGPRPFDQTRNEWVKESQHRLADALEKALRMLDAEPASKYGELLYAVATKFPGESRHETALRYIREREKPSDDQGACNSTDPEAS